MASKIKIIIAVCYTCLIAFPSGGFISADESGDKNVQAVLTEAFQSMNASGDDNVNVFLNEAEGLVQEGDYVRVHYQAKLSDGTLIQLLGVKDGRFLEDYLIKEPGNSDRLTGILLAGDEKAAKGLGSEIVGLKAGDKKHVSLSVERAFGEYRDSRLRTYPRIRKASKRVTLQPNQYYKQFKSFPVPGKKVDFMPYIKAEITDIQIQQVTLNLIAKDGERFQDEFGETVVTVDDETNVITLTLYPKIGAIFKNGKIAELKTDQFLVDYNHPLAGEGIDVTLTVEEIIKPGSFGNNDITWVENYDNGIELARHSGKPIILMLYEDGCPWCEKMFGGTFRDPWIRYFADRYVWIRVNSAEKRQYMKMYGQRSFPTVVLLNANGKAIKTLRGYKRAEAFRRELLDIINHGGFES